jgi:predicted DNA-binding protein
MNPDKWKSIVISIESYRKLKAMAKSEMRTLSGQFTYILEKAVEENERASKS